VVTRNCPDWKPAPGQRRVLEAAQEAGLNRTITATCKEADVVRRTFYYWLRNNECFAKAWDDVWRRAITRHMPSIVSALTGKARKGDVPAARLLADMSGSMRQQIDVTSKGERILPLVIHLPEIDEAVVAEQGAAVEVPPE